MTVSRRKRMLALLVAAIASVPALAFAENDADRVPADAVAYLHFAGRDAMGPAYATSHMKGLFDALKLQQFLVDQMNKHVQEMGDAKKKEQAQTVHDFLQTLAHYPTSVYVGAFDLTAPNKPVPTIAIFSKMGAAKAGEYAAKLNGMPPPDSGEKYAVSAVGDYLLINVGSDADMARRLGATPPTDGLGSTEAFNKTMTQLGTGAAEAPVIIYLNGESGLHVIDDLIMAKGGGQARVWPAIETGLGLTEIKEIAWAGNLDGSDWVGQFFVAMGQNRVGLLDFIDNKPLPEDTIKLIPANATWAAVTPFDGNRILDDIRNTAGEVSPSGQRNFDNVLHQFFAFTGVDLRNDLIASSGDQYAMYTFPDATGKSIPNMVMVTRLKNPQKMDKALSTLENTISAMVMQRDATGTVSFKTEPLDAPNDKVTAHIISFPAASPAWAIRDDVLYIGLSKSAVQHAITNAATGGSIADNPTFNSLKHKLGVGEISGFDYLDLPKVAPEEYALIQHILTERKIAYTLPPLAAITPNLSPYLKVSWTDAAGFHAKSIGPFPVSGSVLSPYQVNMQDLQSTALNRRSAPTTQEKLP